MNPSEKLLLDLIAGLIERTAQGSVTWIPSDSVDSFSYSGTSGAVSVRAKDRDGRHPFLFEVFDGAGRVVETLVTGWDQDEHGNSEPLEWNDQVENLYFSARISALDLQTIANSILGDIDAGRAGAPISPDTGADGPDSDLDDLPF